MFSKTINLIALIYSSSDSSEKEKSLKLSLICITSFSKSIYILLKTLKDNNFLSFLRDESKLNTAKQE